MRPAPLALATSLCFVLAACQPASSPAPAETEAAAPDTAAPADTMPPADDAAPAEAMTDDPASADAAPADAAAAVGDDYPVAREACLDAVASATNVDRTTLTVTEVLWGEAGVGVTIAVPGADAPWSCLSDEDGKVQGAAYTGSEGAL